MIPWKRERLPTPVFWPGEFHGLYGPWDHKESDTTEELSLHGLNKTLLKSISWVYFFYHFKEADGTFKLTSTADTEYFQLPEASWSPPWPASPQLL